MTAANSTSQPAAENDLVITRILDAPRELVFKAWTDPEHVMRWWGPEHYTSPACRIDLRVGGSYLFSMRSPEGQEYWSTGEYQEIVPSERIVYTDHFADADGNIVPPSHYGMPGVPDETVITLTFEDLEGKTRMTLRHAPAPAAPMDEMARMGWNQSFDKLAATLNDAA